MIELTTPKPHIVLIRHPQDKYNVQRKFNGQLDSRLTYEGEYPQLNRLLGQLKNRYTSVDVIYSSPLERALFPAYLAADDFGIPNEEVRIDDRLIERNNGEL